VSSDVIVEIDAMDVAEWEHGQRTPQASDANIAALLEKTAKPAERAGDGPSTAATVARPRLTGSVSPRAATSPPVALPPIVRTLAETPAAPLFSLADASTQFDAVTRPVNPIIRSTRSPGASDAEAAPRAAADRRVSPAGGVVPAPPLGVAQTDVALPPHMARSSGMVPTSPGPGDVARVGRGHAPVRGASPDLSVPDPDDAVRAERASSPNIASRARALSPGVVARAERPTMPSMPSHAPRAPIPPGDGRRTGAGTAKTQGASSPSAAALARAPSMSMVPHSSRPVVDREAPAWSAPQAVPLPLPAPVESARIVAPRIENRASSPVSGRDDSGQRHATSEPEASAAAASPRRRWLWLGGASVCAVAVVAVLLVTSSGFHPQSVATPSDDRAATSPVIAHEVVAHDGVAHEVAAHDGVAHEVAAHDGVARGVAAGDAVAHETGATPAPVSQPAPPASAEVSSPAAPPPAHEITRTAVIRPARRPGKRAGIKPLIVEYSDRRTGSELPGIVAQDSEDPAIAQARAAYVTGNQRLFEGDIDGAIAAYRRALARYPGYVGGYRGLGLAYAQRGDNENALEAFKTYVTTVPNAKDVALIKKRIARLQGK
jgi:hypothetical protein